MVKTEFREIISFGPAVLYRADLFALAALFSEESIFTEISSQYSFTLDRADKTADSITDLLAEAPPVCTDKFTARIQYRSGKEIAAGISLTCYHNYIQCQIHAIDSTWYHGKCDQLRIFFKNHRPWYGRLKRGIMPMTIGPLPLFFGVLIALAARRHDWLSCGAGCAAFLSFVVIVIQEQRQRWFPFVRVFFRDRKVIEWTPELVLAVLSFLVSVVAVVISVVE
jgi:hypothetical protein